MKDGRTHLAHKAEHAVDLQTGAVVAVTVQDADEGDTTTSIETLTQAAEQIEAVGEDSDGPKEFVGDKGYHSNQVLVELEAVGCAATSRHPIAVSATGKIILRRATPCIETAAGFAARAAGA
jgi:transposase